MAASLIIFKNRADFASFRRGKSYSSPLLRLQINTSSDQNTPRFGFIIPKRVIPKVTDRNKIRRRLKTILRSNLRQVKPSEILLFPKKEALYQQHSSLNEEVIKLLKRAQLWKS